MAINSEDKKQNRHFKGNRAIFLMLAILFIGVFLANFVSAFELNPFADKKIFEKEIKADTSDYIKQDFNEKYGVIKLSKTFFWFESDKIAEYSLTKNTEYCIINCEAEGRVVLYVDGVLFTDTAFSTLDGLPTSIKKSEYLIYKGMKDNYVQVPSYKEVCVDLKNGTKDCENVIDKYNSVNQPIEDWQTYNGETLVAGEYRWKIKGVKKQRQDVDFIPIRYDKGFTEWATWQDSYNVGLVAYYPFDNNTDVVTGKYNLSARVGTYDTGWIGNALSNNWTYVTKAMPEMNTSSGKGYTACLWTYSPSGGISQGVFGLVDVTGDKVDGGGLGGGHFGTGTKWQWFIHNGADFTNPPTFTRNGWIFHCIVKNSTGLYHFYNNTIIGSDTTLNTWNGAIAEIVVGAYSNIGDLPWTGKIDELGLWNRSLSVTEMTALWNGGAGMTYIPTAPVGANSTLSVYTINPANDTYTNKTTIGFYSNATSVNLNITNATLHLWGAGETLNTTTFGASVNFTTANLSVSSIAEGNYIWNTEYCATNSTDVVCDYGSNKTIIVDTTSPTFTFNSLPNKTTLTLPINTTLNVTITDTNLEVCQYYTSDNATRVTYTCTAKPNIQFSTGGTKIVYVLANDSAGNLNSTSYLVGINYISVVQSGEATAGDNQEVTFTLLINSTLFGIGDADASLWYNGTNRGVGSKSVIDTHAILFSQSFIIPDGTGNLTGVPQSWFWNYNTTAITTRNTSTQTQNIFSVILQDCEIWGATPKQSFLNLTLQDEETNELVNITSPNEAVIEIDLTLTNPTNSSIQITFAKKWLNNNSVAICLPDGILNTTTYKIDFTIGYSSTDHVQEFYYMENGTLDNSTYFNSYTRNVINLSDLATADSTTFLFEYTDENNQEVPDIIVHTFRNYIGEGVFREVERSKQDNAGQTHVHLVEEDVIYYFMITQYGNILFTSDTYNAKCLSSPCEISLSASASAVNWSIIDNEGGQFSVSSDKSTRIVSTAFNLDSISLVNASVYRFINGSSVLINQSSLTASSGIVKVTVPFNYANASYYVAIYKDNVFVKSSWVDLTEGGINYFGTFGAILGGIVVLTLMLMAVTEGAGFVVVTGLALILVFIMKLVDFGWMALITILCAGGIIVWKLVSRRGARQ